MSSNVIGACTNCYDRNPLTELSKQKMECKKCTQNTRAAICPYCRDEVKGKTSICAKCNSRILQYGYPRKCIICGINAAFFGNNCKWCFYSSKEYDEPINCSWCNKKRAFNRRDKENEVKGKPLCRLCMLSYRRQKALTGYKEPSARENEKKNLSSSPFKPDHPDEMAPFKPDHPDEMDESEAKGINEPELVWIYTGL